MKIQLRKDTLFETLYIEFIIILGLFFGYFEYTSIWNAGILILIFGLIIGSKNFQNAVKNRISLVFFLTLYLFFIVINFILTGYKTFLMYNCIQIMRPLVIITIFYYIDFEKNNIIKTVLDNNFTFLNIMWIINWFILGLQVAGTGFMIKSSWMAKNNFYLDNCTGLFGGSATHVVLLFTIFITLYNLEIGILRFKKRISKKIFIGYIIITDILMMFFSTLNDNNAMFIFFPIFLFCYLYKKKTVSAILFERIKKKIYFFCFIAFMFIILSIIPFVKNLVISGILPKLDSVINFQNTNQMGSVERLAIVDNALRNANGWKYGNGIGYGNIMGYSSPYAGFLHFGISSIGTFVYFLGIWFYLYTCFIYSYIQNFSKKNNIYSFILNFLLIICLSVYTMYFTVTHLIVWSSFIFFLLNKVGEYDYE